MNAAIEKIRNSLEEASNVLVTVGKNPTADELTAALALTLAVDKMNKHASAIFSGKIPHFMSFLHPEKVFENSTDSFRDFVISLDKDKADRLRYKVEGDLVKIFLTPYHTSLGVDDLSFDRGELNVDMVIALGVKRREDLDEAILLSQDKILHSATVVAIDLESTAQFANLNWSNLEFSSYSEAVAKLISDLGEDLITERIATTLLTGIVLATNQFSNEKTRPSTMQAASHLLSRGADQQLIIAEMRHNQTEIDTPIEINHNPPEEVRLHSETVRRRSISPQERKTSNNYTRQENSIDVVELRNTPEIEEAFEVVNSGEEMNPVNTIQNPLGDFMPPEAPVFPTDTTISLPPTGQPSIANVQRAVKKQSSDTGLAKRRKTKKLTKKIQRMSTKSEQPKAQEPEPVSRSENIEQNNDPARFVIPN